jgi:chromatin remodeling complex protein RSC6|uniref:DM2 domain-containing protein n=1 Tax=viral metagenome TaxID=1070528 RepID=A0A6C0CIH4_9ZZZZ
MSVTEQEAIPEVVEDSQIDNQFTSILSTLSQFKVQITALSNQLKGLEKTVKKEIKQHKKEVTKKMSKGNRKPSGFAAASPISNDLCDFMGKDHGSEIARTEVTKFICSYIRENSLTTTENNRVIKPDDKLHVLLGTDDSTQVTYFNIQRYMNRHFISKKSITETK